MNTQDSTDSTPTPAASTSCALPVLQETACGCAECVEMCERRACWPTPDEARALIQAGYGDRLMLDWWAGGGHDGGDILLLSPGEVGREGNRAGSWPGGRCTFLTADKKCELHDAGLKPLEGRAASCDDDVNAGIPLHETVAMTWNNPDAQTLAHEWREARGV